MWTGISPKKRYRDIQSSLHKDEQLLAIREIQTKITMKCVLFTTPERWKQPKEMSIDRWPAKQNVVYTYNGVLLSKDILSQATTCRNLEGMMLSEMSQSQRTNTDSTHRGCLEWPLAQKCNRMVVSREIHTHSYVCFTLKLWHAQWNYHQKG